MRFTTGMRVLVILGRKCTLATSRAARWWLCTARYTIKVRKRREKRQTDRRTDARPLR